MLADVRAYRLAEVRKRQHITQNQVAEILGATQGRVSAIGLGAFVGAGHAGGDLADSVGCVADGGDGRIEIVGCDATSTV
ncbi:helix-turn-helix domain-containing protein [Streptomyces globosus]|uniref:helix-turn-helix domain-containing protein n=1 Tax=Streptomyces globosus TaxID=68209 RepID=UPI001FE5C256|nr:helix-turn-helix transcriptional regulator [Streptomyces globosus]